MDPLSITAGIIAIIQLTSKVIEYLNDVKGASKHRAQCAIEASNLYNLLVNLRYRLEEGSADIPWYTAVRALTVPNGPLDQYQQALEQIQTRLVAKSKTSSMSKTLLWTFGKEEIVSILSRMERLKTLVQIALQMDHLLEFLSNGNKTIY